MCSSWGGELLRAVARPRVRLAAGGQFGPLGPGACVEPVEDFYRGAQLDTSVAAPLRAAKALSVGQVGASVLEHDAALFVQGDRLQEVLVEVGGGEAAAPRGARRR